MMRATSVQVVRLKGGCSTLFARLASELRVLVAAGVPYEVVPGVTSPSAAAAAAGIPLTDAVSAQSMLVATAHAADALPWPAFGPDAIGTLVLLMAGRSLGTVVDGCIEAGWPTETAVRATGRTALRASCAELRLQCASCKCCLSGVCTCHLTIEVVCVRLHRAALASTPAVHSASLGKGVLALNSPVMQVAIVKSAGQPGQSMWRTTLASVMHATKGQKLSPSVIIVGPVASEAGARAPV